MIPWVSKEKYRNTKKQLAQTQFMSQNINMIDKQLTEYAKVAKDWILKRYDQHVAESSEYNYRYNDEIGCTLVVNAAGVAKGILTIWTAGNKLRFHFDKKINNEPAAA